MLEQLRNTPGEAPQVPERPANDVPIVPRSQVRMLTDEGVVDREIEATPMGETTVENQPEAELTPAEAEEAALKALLDQHEASSSDESAATEETPTSETTEPDLDAPEMKAFADQFEKLMGIPLKDAVETFKQTQEQLKQLTEQRQELEFQTAVTNLKSDWGVNDAEFNARIQAVLQYSQKLPENLRAQFDNPRGIRLLWNQISGRSTVQPTSKTVPVQTSSEGKTFRKSELHHMMQTNPGLYNKMQAEIAAAFEAGRVIDDTTI